jgi:uncharacterized membrane protein YphA (DoxX/SURF4 family)
MRKINRTRIYATLVRCGAGLLFVYAGGAKFLDPMLFYSALSGAEWLPPFVARLLMGVLPAAEVALGLALLVGWKRRPTALVAFLLVAAFTFFLLVEAVRGNTNCGCFGSSYVPEFLGTTTGALLRNGVLLLTLAWLAARGARRRLKTTEGRRDGLEAAHNLEAV